MNRIRSSAVLILGLLLAGAGCAAKSDVIPPEPSPEASVQVAEPSAETATSSVKTPDATAATTSMPAAKEKTAPAPAPKPAKKPSPSQPAAVSVLIGDTAFSPDIQVVQEGGKVVFTNKSTKNQTIHSLGNQLYDSGNIPPGKSWSHVFPATGRYEYYTATDPNMRGLIIVR